MLPATTETSVVVDGDAGASNLKPPRPGDTWRCAEIRALPHRRDPAIEQIEFDAAFSERAASRSSESSRRALRRNLRDRT